MNHRRRRHAFTLVELLVVIGIIALLISILFTSTSGTGNSALNMEKLATSGNYRRCTPADMDSDPSGHYAAGTWDGNSYKARLDWVGHNHGNGPYATKTSNFLYLDGHVETKNAKDTLEPFQWGERFYSLSPSTGL
jgi:prepilin-type N-terminal cleavage/methylation domain-containing protein/prepilin-type processing-associated H-X9-DG protein